MIESLLNLDTEITLFINKFHNNFWDLIMFYVSGKYTWTPLYLVLLYLIFRKLHNYKKQITFIIFIAILITISDQVSVLLFKNIFQRLRPCHCETINNIIHTVNNNCGGKFGFISSHASNTFALSTFLILLFKNKFYTVFLLMWAFLIAYSRIYLGVHYFGDVFVGALVGSLIGILIFNIFMLIINKLWQN